MNIFLSAINRACWAAIAWFVTRPAITNWLVRKAVKTPYTHIMSASGKTCYMERYWLFNAYRNDAQGNQLPARWRWLPSVRLHLIREPDRDRHLHDHPWNARTIILEGWYYELLSDESTQVLERGQTKKILFNEYHRILAIKKPSVATLFFTWRYRGTWGFLVDGKKVPHREYLANENRQPSKDHL